MPCTLLVETCSDLLKPVLPSHPETQRKDLLQRGLLHFLQLLDQSMPDESATLVSFSQSADVIVPYTTEVTTLTSALYDLQFEGPKADLRAGLQKCVTNHLRNFGTDEPCQIVVVVGSPESLCGDALSVAVPFPCMIHVVAVGISQGSGAQKLLQQAIEIHTGTEHHIPLSRDATRLCKRAFEHLSKVHFSQYHGTLMCGNITGQVTLDPNPHLLLFTKGPGKEASGSLPGALPVVGFLQAAVMPHPPHISRHMVLPANREPGNDVDLITIVLQCLKREHKMGLVCFNKETDWYGLLGPINGMDGLVLTILRPGENLPWIGNFSDLRPVGVTKGAPDTRLPIPSGKTRSYALKGSNALPRVDSKTLNMDFKEISQFLKNLPKDKDKLFRRCEKLRKASKLFDTPLLEPVEFLVQHELSCGGIKNELGKGMARDLLNQLQGDLVKPIRATEMLTRQKRKEMEIENKADVRAMLN